MTDRKKNKGFLHGIPPWIMIGSVVILLPIFVLWAIDNINRQKDSTTMLLMEKGAALIRSFEAGARTGMMGMMTTRGTGFQLQRLLVETAKLPDIKYITVVDADGYIIAHSDRTRIGEIYDNFSDIEETAFSTELKWRRVVDPEGGYVFEVFRRFSPRHVYSRTRLGKIIIDRDLLNSVQIGDSSQEKMQAIFVGMDMSLIEEARKEDVRHTLLMGAILLLVGLAGISSLFLVNAYRTTKSSLKRIKAFSDNVVENMPIGLVALDPDRKIISINNVAATIFNNARSSVTGMAAESMMPAEVTDLIREINDTKAGIEREISYHTPDGKRLTLEINLSRLEGDDGAFMGYLILLRDITEIRSLKREVERSRRLASIGGLAAGVAHEIRNPLSSIKGFATYFSERYSHVPEDKKTAEIMVREVERLNRVISRLLELAKPVSIEKKSASPGALIQHSIKVIERDAAKKDISIITDIPEDLPLIDLDSDRMNQVLLNLYLNAIEAMDNGGTITVNAEAEKRSGMLRITITDTGRGIDKKDLAHVFDPYFTTKQSGTGLGLSIVHRTIESHNGEIAIESDQGKGTKVTIFLSYK
ncbi:MAG: PAS domain-containing protein [Deltaproteobacteria bacterium]|nr:PAS domain-containing protein [Deltaproteobacteria bacterium]